MNCTDKGPQTCSDAEYVPYEDADNGQDIIHTKDFQIREGMKKISSFPNSYQIIFQKCLFFRTLQIFYFLIDSSKTIFPVCKTIGGKDKHKQCVFPFTYDGLEYGKCTIKDHKVHWCFTEVDDLNVGVKEKWGFCGPGCPST